MKKYLLALVLSLAVISGAIAQAPPVISPAAGPYQNTITVSITEAAPGYSIYYTIDGSAPTASSTLYTGPFTMTKTGVVKAIAVLNPASTVSTSQFTIIPCLVSIPNSWTVHQPIAVGATFQLAFDVTPLTNKMDGVAGVSNGVANAFGSLAAVVRFNPLGFIDAMNGVNFYQAVTAVPYTLGTTYHFILNVNTTAKTYNATVNGVVIATNYGFRPGAIATPLDTLNAFSDSGSLQVCNLLTTNGPPPPAMHSVGLSWDPPVLGGVASYNAYRSVTPGGPYAQIGSGITTKSFSDLSVSNGAIYYYVVTAVDATGAESKFSSEVSTTIPLLRIAPKKGRKKGNGNFKATHRGEKEGQVVNRLQVLG